MITVVLIQGWPGLSAELSAEVERMWLRNLGRDDRLIADRSREARHPFLDENVVDLLQGTPLPLIADFDLPPGKCAFVLHCSALCSCRVSESL